MAEEQERNSEPARTSARWLSSLRVWWRKRAGESDAVRTARIQRNGAIGVAVLALAGSVATVVVSKSSPERTVYQPVTVAPVPATDSPSIAPVESQTGTPTSPTVGQPGTMSLLTLSPLSLEPGNFNSFLPGSVTILRTQYPHALEPSGTFSGCSSYTIAFQTDEKYSHFHALVGVADGSDSVGVEFTVEDEVSQATLGQVSVQAGQSPVPMDVNVSRASKILLIASLYGGCDQTTRATPVFIDPTIN